MAVEPPHVLILAFKGTVAHVMRGATPAEQRAVYASVYRQLCPAEWETDSLQVCTCLNNAAFRWLERVQKSRRIGAVDAQLRAVALNAFFDVNFTRK
jgi:hypothetical protein